MNASKTVRILIVAALVFTTLAFTGISAKAQAANPLDGMIYTSPQGEAYNAVWSGWTLSQPKLPEPDKRTAHTVDIEVPQGTYVFNGVECLLAKSDSGRVEVAMQENGAQFLVMAQSKYVVMCNESPMSGFTVTELSTSQQLPTSTNPMVGYNFQSKAGKEYTATWGGKTGWWLYQPNLPKTRKAHTVDIYLWPGMSYKFNGKVCSLADGDNKVVAKNANAVEFAVAEGKDIVRYQVSCRSGAASGFSIETIDEPEEPIQFTVSTVDWANFVKLQAAQKAAATPEVKK